MVLCFSNAEPAQKNSAATKPMLAASNVYASCSAMETPNAELTGRGIGKLNNETVL